MHTNSPRSAQHTAARSAGIRSTAIFLVLLLVFGTCGWFAYHAIVDHRTPTQLVTQQGPNTTLTIGTTEALNSLNIQTDTSTALDQVLLNNVYETLLNRDQHNKPVAGIAQSWSQSDDGLQYTFQLHQHMNFANGHTLDADDVVWSLQQVIEHQFVGHEYLRNISQVTAPNKQTVQITLSAPNPELAWALTTRAGIVYDNETKLDYAKQTAGSGPFTISKFNAGKAVTLEYNGQYWADKAKVGSIIIRPYTDAQQAAQDFLSGSLDALIPVQEQALATVQDAAKQQQNNGSRGITIQQIQDTGKLVLAFNSSADSQFSEQAMRVGARRALNKQTLIDITHTGAMLGGPLTTVDPGYSDLTHMYPYDKAGAARSLAYFRYRTLQKTLLVDTSVDERITDSIVQQLRQVGLNFNVNRVEPAAWQEQFNNHQFDAALVHLQNSHDFGWYVASDNAMQFTDSQSEQLYEQAMQAKNSQEYEQALTKYAQRLGEVSPVDWLYQDSPWIAWHNTVSNLPTAMVSGYLPLRNTSVQE